MSSRSPLATSLSRRSAVALGGSVLALAGMPALAREATPGASPVAAAIPAPTTAEVLPTYRKLADAIREAGRAVLDPLLAGDAAPLDAALAPDARQALSAPDVAASLAGLQANQIRFSFAEVGAHWVGTVGDGVITGFFEQAGARDTFSLTPADGTATPLASPAASPAASPVVAAYPAGTWAGSLDALKLPFAIAFSGNAASPAATITIEEQGIVEAPLSGVAFLPDAPFGAVTAERAVPISPALHAYSQEREWAGGAIQLDLIFADDAVTAIQAQPALVLSEDPAAGYVSEITYRLPWQEGAWFVFWGGPTEMQNYHVVAPNQRHASDIVVWKDGSTFDGDGSRADQYWIWGQPLVAPAAGTVVAALNDQPDQVPGQSLSQTNPDAFRTLHPAGNHVVLQTAEAEFVYLAHMQKGSVRVQAGDILGAGDPLGLVGNSGNTTEPHLHIHVQNVADFYDPQAVGLPLVFSDLTVDGEPATGGDLLQGTFVEPVVS